DEVSAHGGGMDDERKQLLDSLSHTHYIVRSSHNAIQANSNKLSECIINEDINAILAFYDDDIELLEMSAPICRGIEALQIYYETMKKIGLRVEERKPTELHTLSPFIVIERGRYNIRRSRSKLVEGRYFALWINRKSWKIIQECRVPHT
uniref:NTF2 fold immunity protein domain-containing protein n=1 Tax=Parascaris univalens TaxID=6257 RepID=A0A915ACP3_PARUN